MSAAAGGVRAGQGARSQARYACATPRKFSRPLAWIFGGVHLDEFFAAEPAKEKDTTTALLACLPFVTNKEQQNSSNYGENNPVPCRP